MKNPFISLFELEQKEFWHELCDIVQTDKFKDELTAFCAAGPTYEDMSQYHTITHEQYQEFEQYLVIDILKGLRFGQAFCERFGISNASPLYHFKGREIAERWIRDNYIVKT